MKSFCFIVVMFVAASKIFPQEIGIWKNYTDMKNVREISLNENNLWAATEGGIFGYKIDEGIFETFTKSEGFSSQNITCLDIDNKGRIWIGSEEGFINVYDPSDKSIKKILDIYSTDKTQKRINDIKIDANYVYVSTDFGLSLIDTQTLTFSETILKFGNFISESKVYSINLGNTIYVTTEDGIALLKAGSSNLSAPESWNTYSIKSDIPADTVFEAAEFQGYLIASTDKGIFRLENNVWNSYLFASQKIKDISVNGNLLYVLLNNSLYKITGFGDEQIYSSSETSLNSLFIQDEQNIFIASLNGVKLISNQNAEDIIPNGPGSNFFQSIAIDSESNLWAGSGNDRFGVGIFKFDGNSWETFNTKSNPELSSNSYHKAYAAPNGKVYFSNWGKGFTEYNDGIFNNYNAANTEIQGISIDPNFVVISEVQNDAANNTWLLNFWSNNAKPLSVKTVDNKWYHYSFPNPLITNIEECVLLAIDRNNTKWFSVQQGQFGGTLGLYYYNENSTFETVSDDAYGYLNEGSGLNSSDIRSIVVDKRGEVWVGTSIGINIIPNPSAPNSGIRNVLPVRFETISTIAVDPINQKWVGTQNGIFVLSSDGVKVVAEYSTANSPLPTNSIRSIAFDDKKGIAYIGTDFGLSKLTTASIEPKEQFEELFIYPNPFIIDGSSDKQITIDGLLKDSQIKIISISGKLIKEFISPGGRVAFWDGKDENGDLVSTGVYIIVAFDNEASNIAKSKVAVIRK